MSPKVKVFVVVPSYNEGSVLRHTLAPLLAARYSVVIVDDGSTDGTRQQIAGLDVHCLRHPINLGQGAAIQTGTSFAIARGAEVVVHFDADGQHDAGDIPALIAPVVSDEADVVFGSRFLRPGDAGEIPGGRRMLLRGAVKVNALLTLLPLTDAHNGLRALSRRAAMRIYLKENGYAHATEIVEQVRKNRLRWTERPCRARYSTYSLAKGQSGFNALNVLVDVFLRRLLG